MSTRHTKNHMEDWQQKILAESKGPIRFTPKSDYMFKAICQTNTYALEGLLGATVYEKDCVLDVKLKLNTDHIINIEMQVLFQNDWIERSLVYTCRTVSGQLKLAIFILEKSHWLW